MWYIYAMIVILLIAGVVSICLFAYLVMRLIPRRAKSADDIEETNW